MFSYDNKQESETVSFYLDLYLPKPIFTHGQLYVAVSRVKTKRGLKILCLDEEEQPCNCTKNIVYKEVFRNL
ncbi:hypothetical protein ACS0TY_019025 [Phlomoides rotata]